MGGVSAPFMSRGTGYSFWPVFFGLLTLMASLAYLAHRSSLQQAHHELEREQSQVSRYFDYETQALGSALVQADKLIGLMLAQNRRFSSDEEIARHLETLHLDYAAIIDGRSGGIISEHGESVVSGRRRDFVAALVGMSKMRGIGETKIGIGQEARLMQDGHDALIFVSMPIGRNMVLVATRPVNTAMIRRAGSVLGLEDLRITAGSNPKRASIMLAGLNGNTDLNLTWISERVASDILLTLSFYAGLSALVVVLAAVFLFSRLQISMQAMLMREAAARHEAHIDALSGLPNRAAFREELSTRLANIDKAHGITAVMLIDLDRFKDVNDIYGHAAGDKVIIDFGQRVRALLNRDDMIARLGGDEFAMLVSGLNGREEIERIAQALVDAGTRPFEISGVLIRIGATVGVALAPQDSTELSGILSAADAALYRAKSEGRNRFALYEHKTSAEEDMRNLVSAELREAIDLGQLHLLYQPQVDARTHAIVGVEALVRWQHPERGLISPVQFIPAAEATGLISLLGSWVLRQACWDAQRWPNLRVSVNVSAVQFRDNTLVEEFRRILHETGFDPQRLELELTESALIDDAKSANAVIKAFRGLGLRLALDDFGTGYASMMYLRRFSFDKIKIDKSFIDEVETNRDSRILVCSLLKLGKELGIEVTAEGVETASQAAMLAEANCTYLQGYFFSKPVPAQMIDKRLAKEVADKVETASMAFTHKVHAAQGAIKTHFAA